MQVRCPGRSRGTGFLIADDLVLTAAHVVADAAEPGVGVEVRLFDPAKPLEMPWVSAQVVPAGTNAEELDVALLRVAPGGLSAPGVPIPAWGRIEGTGPVPVFAVCFPKAMKDDAGLDSHVVRGVVEPLQGATRFVIGEATLMIAGSIVPDRGSFDDSPWSGGSGAAVFAANTGQLVGVLTEDFKIATDASVLRFTLVAKVDGLAERAGVPQVAPVGPRRRIQWPVLVGDPPPEADSFQRRPELTELYQAFFDAKGVVVTEPAQAPVPARILSGLGGVGKTQLAAKYAWSEWDAKHLHLLVWVNASSRANIVSAYAAAAEVLGLVSEKTRDIEGAAQRFRSWLATDADREWLIVLDDVKHPGDLAHLKPRLTLRGQGRCIITTRERDPSYVAKGWEQLEINIYTARQAASYIHARLKDYPAALDDVDGLAEDLGFLPLALAQATGLIAHIAAAGGRIEGPGTCKAYRDLLRDRKQTLKKIMPYEHIDEYGVTLAATWSISIEHANEQPPPGVAARVMKLLSLLDPNGIPVTILDTEAIRAYLEVGSRQEIEAGVRALRSLSLIDCGEGSDTIRVHVLVQRAVRETAQTEPDQAARLLADSLDSLLQKQQDDRDLMQVLRSNAQKLSEQSMEALLSPQRLHHVLIQLGDSYGQAGLVHEAERYFAALREQASQTLGPDARETLKIRERGAYWLGFIGNVEAAHQEFEVLAADWARIFRPEDPDTFLARHNVARFRGRNGDPSGAVAELELLVADQTRALDPLDPQALESRGILGYWRTMAGDHDRAVAEIEELRANVVDGLGPDHPLTLTIRNDLAIARFESGDRAGAIADLESVVEDRARMLGPENVAVLSSKARLAYWKALSSDHDGSAAEVAATVDEHLRLLGDEHPNTLRAQSFLIEARAEEGDTETAVRDMSELVTRLEDILGPTHILTTHCREWWDTRTTGVANDT